MFQLYFSDLFIKVNSPIWFSGNLGKSGKEFSETSLSSYDEMTRLENGSATLTTVGEPETGDF